MYKYVNLNVCSYLQVCISISIFMDKYVYLQKSISKSIYIFKYEFRFFLQICISIRKYTYKNDKIYAYNYFFTIIMIFDKIDHGGE
jgi:hypothetical protein